MRYILFSSGNIPVDRKSKDRQVLFKGTIEALAKGEAVALFPEGTSYTEPRIMQVKDGAAWAAMEYVKWARENPDKAKYEDVTIVPVAIVYTSKSKYRSRVRAFCGVLAVLADSIWLSCRSSWSALRRLQKLNLSLMGVMT
jgi:glycerol-3-phosphate O-acyltransferase/dihydroxyacetone phosphate acyltransferase